MMYGIWCEVWGGMTGSRASWAKKNNEIIRFETKEAAQSIADSWQARAMGNTYRTANFSYTVRELTLRDGLDVELVITKKENSVYAYFNEELAQFPKDLTLRNLPVDSNCGADCCEVIKLAAGLLVHTDSMVRADIIAAIEDDISIKWHG